MADQRTRPLTAVTWRTMIESPFSEWLEDVASDEVVIDPEDIREECLTNLWAFSLSREQAGGVTVQGVKDFILEVVRARSARMADLHRPPGSMVFYCWHDFQAGQLRFSMVSASHGFLPFGNPLQKVEDVELIIRFWLESPWLHGILLEDLTCVPMDSEAVQEEDDEEWVVSVWSTSV